MSDTQNRDRKAAQGMQRGNCSVYAAYKQRGNCSVSEAICLDGRTGDRIRKYLELHTKR